MRVLLCGGGTAGHINPAIAVAEELRRISPSSEILFIGREGGRENELVRIRDIQVKTIRIQGLRRSLSPKNLKCLAYAIKAKNTAKQIIREFKPDVILGTGGYVCWPVISAGRELGIKTAIHESNISPGLTTRLLSRKVDLVLINKEKTAEYLFKKAIIKTVGNPIRADFSKYNRVSARRRLNIKENEFLIVSFGGSIGSEKMNNAILKMMEEYSSKERNVRHVHAVGRRYYSELKECSFRSERMGCHVLPYIDDMPLWLSAADIAICRCGAVTLSEICAAGVASILIPSPNVTDNHQYKNAAYLVSKGGAVLIEEKNLTLESLNKAVKDLKSDENGRKNRAKILRRLSTPDAAKNVVNELLSLINGG